MPQSARQAASLQCGGDLAARNRALSRQLLLLLLLHADTVNKLQQLLSSLILILSRLLGDGKAHFPQNMNVSDVVGYVDITAAEYRTAVRTRPTAASIYDLQNSK